MNDLISKQAVLDILLLEPEITSWQLEMINKLPSAQPDWGKHVGNGRPLADCEIIPRLQDIKRQIGGSYAIDRAIDVLEQLSSAQPDKDMIHLQREQAYLQGWEDGCKALREEIWEDGRDRLD